MAPATNAPDFAAPRPLLGYIHVPPEFPARHIEILRRSTAAFASQEGFVKTPPAGNQVPTDCVADLVLAALPSAIPCARLLVDWVVRSWQLDRACAQTTRHLVDELVAHTVATTGIPENQPMHREVFAWLTLLDVRLSLAPRTLLVEVWDTGVELPDARLAESPALLAASDWGYQLARPGQRLVWCTVPAFPADPEQTIQLPRLPGRRIRKRPKGQPAELIRDPGLLQQVLDGLRALDTDKENDADRR